MVEAKLGSFSTEARQVGRSFSILIAAQKLREQLARMEFVCHENAAHLFPRLEDPHQKGHIHRGSENSRVFCTRRAASKGLSLDRLPEQMDAFALALENFRARLDEFREYDDGSINMKASIRLFEGDLRVLNRCAFIGMFTDIFIQYWASCLRVYQRN
jgi:hypothetical protein